MATINLREIYPFYHEDCIVKVSDEVAALLHQSIRKEAAYQRKLFRYKAYFSLDRDPHKAQGLMYVSMTPEEIYERKISREQLHVAIASLPGKQAKRVYAFYFLGMSQSQIAISENISREAVQQSIARGMKRIGRFLKTNHFER